MPVSPATNPLPQYAERLWMNEDRVPLPVDHVEVRRCWGVGATRVREFARAHDPIGLRAPGRCP